jgi:dienelactone hydrolase
MKHLTPLGVLALSLASLTAACGGSDPTATTQGTGGAATTTGSSSEGGSGGALATTGAGGASGPTTGGSTTGASTTTTTASSGAGGGSMVADPDLDGPYTVAELTDKIDVAASGDKGLDVHCAYPTAGPAAGPYPVIVVGHGFSIPGTEYASYLKRLASFGYVALTVDYPGSIQAGVNNVKQAQDMIGGLDWAGKKAELAGKANVNLAGMSGHSLGGKVAFLAATMDARVKAAITLDPVDGAMNCSAQNCPDVSDLMPTLTIPTAMLGETTDASGGPGGMSCAPAANNYTTFYASAVTPSLSVTVNGANHMSFVDDPSACPLLFGIINPCTSCNAATLAQGTALALSRSFVVAFYERHLRGDLGYDTYLTGAQAQARYVATNLATIVSK